MDAGNSIQTQFYIPLHAQYHQKVYAQAVKDSQLRMGFERLLSEKMYAQALALVPLRQRLYEPSSLSQADKAHQHNTHTGLERTRRDEANRVGPDRTRVPIITAGKEEPTDEVNLVLNSGPDDTGTTGSASDRSDFGRPEDAGYTSPPPAMLPNASGPKRQRGQRQNTTRTERERIGREDGDSVGPGRTREPDSRRVGRSRVLAPG